MKKVKAQEELTNHLSKLFPFTYEENETQKCLSAMWYGHLGLAYPTGATVLLLPLFFPPLFFLLALFSVSYLIILLLPLAFKRCVLSGEGLIRCLELRDLSSHIPEDHWCFKREGNTWRQKRFKTLIGVQICEHMCQKSISTMVGLLGGPKTRSTYSWLDFCKRKKFSLNRWVLALFDKTLSNNLKI